MQVLAALRPNRRMWAVVLSPLVTQQREFTALHKVPSMMVSGLMHMHFAPGIPGLFGRQEYWRLNAKKSWCLFSSYQEPYGCDVGTVKPSGNPNNIPAEK